jgi:hypothetical protein
LYQGKIGLLENTFVMSSTVDPNMPTPAPTLAPTFTRTPTHSPTTAKPTQAPSVSSHPTPSPQFSFTSTACNSPVALVFDVTLGGYQDKCLSIGASGDLTNAEVKMTFQRNAAGLETPSDIGVTVYHTGTGRGVQLGGYSYVDAGGGVNRVAWPRTWNSLDSSSSNSASVSLSGYGVGGSAGYYRVCLVNGYKYGGSVRYSGSVGLNGLFMDCAVASPIPTRAPTQHPTLSSRLQLVDHSLLGQTVNVSFDAVTRGGDVDCINVGSTGTWSGIFLALDFQGDNLTWASDLLVSISKPAKDECFHVGGSTVDMALGAACEFVIYWPQTMDTAEAAQYAVREELPFGGSAASGYATYEVSVT